MDHRCHVAKSEMFKRKEPQRCRRDTVGDYPSSKEFITAWEGVLKGLCEKRVVLEEHNNEEGVDTESSDSLAFLESRCHCAVCFPFLGNYTFAPIARTVANITINNE